MDQKLPYYMAYPTPLLYDDERRDRMDFELYEKYVSGCGEAASSIYRG